MNRTAVRVLLLAVVVAGATVAVAWWAVPIIGFVFGLVATRRGRMWAALTPGVAAFLGWGVLLLWTMSRGGADRVASVMGGVLGVPGAAMYLLTPLYGGLLGFGAGLLGTAVLRNRPRPDA